MDEMQEQEVENLKDQLPQSKREKLTQIFQLEKRWVDTKADLQIELQILEEPLKDIALKLQAQLKHLKGFPFQDSILARREARRQAASSPDPMKQYHAKLDLLTLDVGEKLLAIAGRAALEKEYQVG